MTDTDDVGLFAYTREDGLVEHFPNRFGKNPVYILEDAGEFTVMHNDEPCGSFATLVLANNIMGMII